MLRLPCDPEELATELSRPLAARDRRRLTVQSLWLERGESADSARLMLLVRARSHGQSAEEQWRVALPVGAQDLDPAVSRQALVVTLRANLEEWWDTKGFDAVSRTLGTRIHESGDAGDRG
jgi:hypothetical protein